MEPVWSPYIQSQQEDNWTVVPDAATRKKIQNRLAQRAHRAKYGRKPATKKDKSSTANAASSSEQAPSQSSQPEAPATETPSQPTLDVQEVQSEQSAATETASQPNLDGQDVQSEQTELIPVAEPLSYSETVNWEQDIFIPGPTTDNTYLFIQGLSTLSAIITNAALLHINCAPATRHTPLPLLPAPDQPPSLAPTVLQSQIPHFPYLDLIPLPPLRDKLLRYNVDPYEIWADLTAGELKVWGSTPWVSNGWEISERFAVKWWFLMSDEILGGTNFWRGVRGEGALSWEGVKGRVEGIVG